LSIGRVPRPQQLKIAWADQSHDSKQTKQGLDSK